MRKIIKLVEGSVIPDGAVFLRSEQVQEFDKYEYYSRAGLFITTDYRRAVMKSVIYFYYEVEIK